VSPNHDYPAFWRYLMRLAHEIAQNGCTVAYFGVALPEQILANTDMVQYFEAVHILGLVCREGDLRARIVGRPGGEAAAARLDVHLEINRRIAESASTTPNMALVDASRAIDDVELDIRRWIASIVTRRD